MTADAPVEESPLIVFAVTVDDVPDEPMAIPVIAPALLIPEIVLPLIRFPLPPLAPPKLELMATTALVPAVILLMVLLKIL